MAKIHTIDGVQYREVARDAKVGDFLLFEEAPYSFLTSGKVYKVTGIDSYGDPKIIDDEGDKIPIEEGYVVLEQVGAADLYALESELAEMKAKVAEMERQLADAKAAARLNVGDYAKVVKPTAGFSVKGQIVKITKVDDSDIPYNTQGMDGKYTGWHEATDLVRATDEEVAEAKRKLAFDHLKKGDKVRLMNGGGKFPLHGFQDGNIYEVATPEYAHSRGTKVQIVDGGGYKGYADPDQIVSVTEEEAKWHAIGRKVGEFKKGDVVRIVPKNVIGKVEDVGTSLLGICDYSGKYYGPGKECVELIAPIESIVNLSAS